MTSRSFDVRFYRPGVPVHVFLSIEPPAGTLAYALEETPPSGWLVTDHAGLSLVGGILKAGVFFDGLHRTFNYTAVPPLMTVPSLFSGVVSFDGKSERIGGQTLLSLDSLPPASPIDLKASLA